MKGKRWVLGIGVVALVAAVLVGLSWGAPSTVAQAATPIRQGAEAGMPRSITVVGEGKVSVTPDTAQATIGVETIADTVREGTSESTKTMETVIKALKKAGVADKDIQTSGYSIWSDRSSDTQVTYHITNQVTVTIRDLDTVGKVLDAAIEAGANNMYGVNYAVEDPNEYAAEAREAAVANALAKAGELAELNGVEVGQVVSISEIVGGVGYYPRGAMMDGLGGGGGPFEPGEMEVSVQLEIVYAIQ